MIAITTSANQLDAAPPRWQQLLAQAVSDPAELLELLDLDAAWLPQARAAARLFPLRTPRGFIARMRRRDPYDPLLRQVLPLAEELQVARGFSEDPVGDLASRRGAGVLQKYHGRALLIATGACAVHCRYCFRRHFPYEDDNASAFGWRAALEAIDHDASIKEVILSGGDPLSLSDRRLAQLIHALEQIPHVQRLRIHTRQVVVLPERVDASLLAWLRSTRLQKIVVVHVNHAQEIDAAVMHACRELKAAGAHLLNQSVLLAGINDSAAALTELSEALFAAGVLPYYLHQLDRVQGAAHFEVDDARATALVRELLARLPGYLVPKLVREIPARASKTPIPL